MIPLFSAEGLRDLDAFVRPGMLVALDYDGTLAALTDDPLSAHMRPETRALLGRVASRFPTLVLTGRARSDALRLLGAIDGVEVIGNHGGETVDADADDFSELVAGWRAELHAEFGAAAGIVIEDKIQSLSVHYRQAPRRDAARRRIEAAVAALAGARQVGGKCVVNVVPEGAPDKGSALVAAMARAGVARALFAGDDTTDEHVFELDLPGRLFPIRVGAAERSAARYLIEDQAGIDALLERLARPH